MSRGMNATETSPAADTATFRFPTSRAAWNFMRACDARGFSAGFPSLDGMHAVQVAIRTWTDREAVDALASGAECVGYRFAFESR